ncbi:Pimeloyl-ACP methyl ester carboxylesterase [Paracoccus isoporae]|uniref:Pimeloyl-ACP methyl ester carboxylesterase n=1 Tax=Paracoccus isoporae TaxID=591205 RepID=A0A1G6ZCZ5_9RHOB|nr:alpha/beta fold hydrolase [Paracoccus isoporae]SDE00440.1 Pimeloyl-ACP methyl ester carboxylesterase [Paracoccus isoporae]
MIPLVLLPGMMCDARLFGPQIAALGTDRALHLPPIGQHDTMQAIAASVLAHAPPRFALAGLSMGGIVAMEMLAQAPERIERLALLDTNPRAELPEVQANRAPQIAAVEAGRLRAVMRDEMKPNYLADGPGKQAVLDLCMEMATDLGPQVFVNQSRALRDRPDRQDVLRGATVPTLILCGREDRLCPVERHELMHRLIPGSVLRIIEGAGHLPVLEQPGETTAALRHWLEA